MGKRGGEAGEALRYRFPSRLFSFAHILAAVFGLLLLVVAIAWMENSELWEL
jgi:hypothetical protein